jgi:uncharacterized YccA/Bax inhibitor family protein
MLVVYKTGAIRVTPKFTRMLTAALIGALVLMLGNLVISMFGSHDGGPLRNGGTMAIIVSLVMIVIAAFISPMRTERALARALVAPVPFLEVHVDTPLAVAEARDVKGL